MANKSFVFSLVILLAALGVVALIYIRPIPVVVQTNLEKLPLNISGYTATEDSFSDDIYKELNADKHIYRHYRNASGKQIDLYIGYYGTAKGGRTGHNPYACLPGGGSSIIDTGKVSVKQASDGNSVSVNFILARKNDVNTLMLHWYQTAGKKVISSGFKQNIERFNGKIFRNRNDGAFIQITASSSNSDIQSTKRSLEEFAGAVLKLLPLHWPVEK